MKNRRKGLTWLRRRGFGAATALAELAAGT
jgi:hypothetical protein